MTDPFGTTHYDRTGQTRIKEESVTDHLYRAAYEALVAELVRRGVLEVDEYAEPCGWRCDVVTYEFENIPTAAAQGSATGQSADQQLGETGQNRVTGDQQGNG